MPKPVSYDLSRIDARIIVYSDRIHAGTKEDRATPACAQALERAGLGSVSSTVVPESRDALEAQIREAIGSGARFVWRSPVSRSRFAPTGWLTRLCRACLARSWG